MSYVKTNWVNDTTPINATNLNHIEDGIETLDTDVTNLKQKQILSATINSDVTLDTNTDIPLTLVLNNSVGDKLTISNGSIVIGSGVTKVLISAKGQYSTIASSTNARYLKVKKNGTEIIVARETPVSNGLGLSLSLPNQLINVNENDVITMTIQGYNGDVFRSSSVWTYITIEVIE